VARTVVLCQINPGLQIIGTPPPIYPGVVYSFVFQSRGGVAGSYKFVETGALPTGITFTDNGNGTATLAGTTTATGTYPITVQLSNTGQLAVQQDYLLDVPALVLHLVQNGLIYRNVALAAGQLYLTASGGSNAGYVYSATSLPAAANGTSSSITGTTLTVGGTVTGNFAVGSYITGSTTAANTRITALGTGTGGAGTYTVSISQTVTTASLTGSLALNVNTGAITGTPITIASYAATGSVTDSGANTATTSHPIVVNSKLLGKNVSPTPMESGTAYSYTFSVTGATGAVTWALASGSWPTGVSLSSAGVLSGTPLGAASTVTASVTATDAGTGDVSTFNLSFPHYGFFGGTSQGLIGTITVGTPLVISNIGITGGVAPFSKFTTGSLPAGLTLTFDNNGVMTAKATQAFTPANIVITNITDSLGGTTNAVSFYLAAVVPNNSIIPQRNGTAVTAVGGPYILNATGALAPDVTNDGTTVTWTFNRDVIRARVATAAALPANTYANGTSGIGATITITATGTLTVDGWLTALGDIILVRNEAAQANNGAYIVTTAGAVGVAAVLTRLTVMDEPTEFSGH
jgi:hypothetical protein